MSGYIGVDDAVYARTLGEHLSAAVAARGWGARRLAVLAGIRPRRLKRILAGKRQAGAAEYGRLLQALGLEQGAFDRELLIAVQVAQFAHEIAVEESERRVEDVFG